MEKLINEFFSGHSLRAYQLFGAHFINDEKVGVRFTVYAPNVKNVQIVGDFNQWNGDYHYLKEIDGRGVWQIYVPDLKVWTLYKYRIETFSGTWIEKSDPFGFFHELRPKTSSIVVDLSIFNWTDTKWLDKRSKNFDLPLNIYEVHLGSWRKEAGRWQELDDWLQQLIPYVKANGFTHIELLPLTEHPFDGSWGYQTTGYYALTSRYGTPDEMMSFINACHNEDIGIILDVVPAHFVKDSHGLANFTGEALYEPDSPSDANNQWGTLNFDFSKETVRSFLMSSFAYWLDYYHIDGLRFDAVANLIYWGGNKNRGVNQAALDFIKRKNYNLNQQFPTVMLIAEDSSDFQKVTVKTEDGGLGYDYKWDLGWMNDTLRYYQLDPLYRKDNHNLITFSMYYFYSENFLLPFSHDEVVHMKGSLINKLWGNYQAKFSQLRNLMGYMFAHPGKKLNFMGNEIANFEEWDEEKSVQFDLLRYPIHQAYLRYFKDLSQIYRHHPSLFAGDFDPTSFRWIDADNADQSIFSFVREVDDELLVCILNMTPTSYENYEIGVPYLGQYQEILNSEKDIYHGCNMANFQPLEAKTGWRHNLPYYLTIGIAPFACIYFLLKKTEIVEA